MARGARSSSRRAGCGSCSARGADAFLRSHPAPRPGELSPQRAWSRPCADVRLEVRTGECFVIMGLSGLGQVDPGALPGAADRAHRRPGAARRPRPAGREPARELIELRRHKLGMVFQHFALLPLPDRAGQRRLPAGSPGRRPRRPRGARARDDPAGRASRAASTTTRASSPAASSSGSASPARWPSGPELWFLDEPFSALDPLIRREMQNEFLRLQAALQKTIVFITHDFDEAVRLADRIAIMRDGADRPDRHARGADPAARPTPTSPSSPATRRGPGS